MKQLTTVEEYERIICTIIVILFFTLLNIMIIMRWT